MAEFQSPRFMGDDLLLAILNDPDTGNLKLGPGSPPASVISLQHALFDMGWTLRISPPFPDPTQFVIGVYGPVTKRTVVAYKTQYGIHFPPDAARGFVDEFAGPRTFARLDAQIAPFDESVVAIEVKIEELRAGGMDVVPDTVPPATLPVLHTRTAARHAFLDNAPGAIYHSATTDSHEVHGGLFMAYLKHGGAAGGLGAPISDVFFDFDGFERCDFEHGSLVLDRETGTARLV